MLTDNFVIKFSDTTANLVYLGDSDNRILLTLTDNNSKESFAVVVERKEFGLMANFMKGFYEKINTINGFDKNDSSVHYGI